MSEFACPKYEIINWLKVEYCLTVLLKDSVDPSAYFTGSKGKFITQYRLSGNRFVLTADNIAEACHFLWNPSASEISDFNAKYEDVFFACLNRHWDDFFVKTRLDVDAIDIETLSPSDEYDKLFACIAKKTASLFERIVETGERFLPLLTAYRSKASLLLSKIETETETVDRFNDTPQIPESAGTDLEDDPYVTNLRKLKSISKTDPGSVPSQLEECYRFLHNILEDWANQLDLCFVPYIEED